MIGRLLLAVIGLALLTGAANAAEPARTDLKDARRAFESAPTDPASAVRLATILASVGLHEEARAALDAASLSGEIDVFEDLAPAPSDERCENCDDRGLASGPDVVVARISGLGNYGFREVDGRFIHAFSIGTTSCNLGDTPMDWEPATPLHPVITQNIYRLKEGRFEHIGQSWVKHGFASLNETYCSNDCQTPVPPDSTVLAVNCSDPYAAATNGVQGTLGPRHEINAATGVFPYPYGVGTPPAESGIGRRVQVDRDDLEPALNVGARYFAESQYVHPQDAASGNDDNNASHREFTFSASPSNPNYIVALTVVGPTQEQSAAVHAWADADPAVQITEVDVPGDGRFLLASRVFDNGDGTWDYEYALFNLNSHRAAGSFAIPLPAVAGAESIGFHDVDYHSGDGDGGVSIDGTDWSSSVDRGISGAVSWATTPFEQDSNANALRFGTLYNFRFTSDAPPAPALAAIGLWRPPGEGEPGQVTAATQGPACVLVGDYNGDRMVDFQDLNIILSSFNGEYGFEDLNNVLSQFNSGC